MDQSHKNIPIGDTGVWREETEAGGEREWRFGWFSVVVNGFREECLS